MNDRLLVVLCVPLCIAGGAAGAWFASPAREVAAERSVEPRSGGVDEDAVAALRSEMDRRFERIDMRLADLADARRSAVADSSAPSAAAPGAPDAASDGTGAKDDGKVGEDEIAALFGGGIGDGERWDLLDRLRKSGQLDEVLERLQERADANPNDPEAQFEVGMAYIMKLQSVGASFEAGPLATRADRAFDLALALDEDHLGARKAKAISLSFWPPIFGKQPKAIEQFEILIDKQKQFPPNPDFADSYVLLGNLYLQSGKTDEAAKVFQQGLDAYPDDEALADLMKDVQGDE